MEPLPILNGERTALLLEQTDKTRAEQEVRCQCPECGQHIAIKKQIVGLLAAINWYLR